MCREEYHEKERCLSVHGRGVPTFQPRGGRGTFQPMGVYLPANGGYLPSSQWGSTFLQMGVNYIPADEGRGVFTVQLMGGSTHFPADGGGTTYLPGTGGG